MNESISPDFSYNEGDTLYITKNGAKITKTHGRFKISFKNQKLGEVLINNISRICIFGNVILTPQSLNYCLDNDIPIYHFTTYGNYRGVTSGSEIKSYEIQENQLLLDDKKVRMFSYYIIKSLIENRISVLKWKKNKINNEIFDKIEDLKNKISMNLEIDTLRGYEGILSKYYWEVFPKMLVDPSLFNGRSKRPPRDPANSLLSFSYVLFGTELETPIRYYGLNPFKGFLHQHRHGRKSLVQDMIEQFRPIIEKFVIGLLNQNIISNNDFTKEGISYQLTAKGKRRFLAEFENFMTKKFKTDYGKIGLRGICQYQVQKLVMFILDEADKYLAFKLKV